MDDNYDFCEYTLRTETSIGTKYCKPIKTGSNYCDECFTYDNLKKRYPGQ